MDDVRSVTRSMNPTESMTLSVCTDGRRRECKISHPSVCYLSFVLLFIHFIK